MRLIGSGKLLKIRTWIQSNNKDYIYISLLILLGIVTRIYGLSNYPGGINQDEAYAGYEAYCLGHYGTDSFGYHNPVYFTAWGSGMNVMYSYLLIPFISVFGVHTWVIRLPQAIMSIITIGVLYKLVRKYYSDNVAFCIAGFLAICPWHIMASRWGLESNLAPAFLLLALYFGVKGIENHKFLIISALLYGGSLYCYATIWIIVPIILILQVTYLLYIKSITFDRYFIGAVAIVLVLAFPLILFIAINRGLMTEIKTPFFSIPKLLSYRGEEISFDKIGDNLKNVWNIIYYQRDGLTWNSTDDYGLYYYGTFIFTLVGFVCSVKIAINSIKSKKSDLNVYLLIWFVSALFLGTVVNVNITRINSIHLCIVVYTAIGFICFINMLRMEYRWIMCILLVGIIYLFVSFEVYYTGEYEQYVGYEFQSGVEDALLYAEQLAEEYNNQSININQIAYPKVLLFGKVSPEMFQNSAQYTEYPAAFLHPLRIDKYNFDIEPSGEKGIYLLQNFSNTDYAKMGYSVRKFEHIEVLYK